VEGPTVKEGAGIVEGETETGRWIDYEEDRKGCRRNTSRNHTGTREEREWIGGENERKSLTGCEGMEVGV
jgi:hypothetical protein